MAIKIQLKESHYKNSRFNNNSEKELAKFKQDNITQDLNEIKNIVTDNILVQTEILKSKHDFIKIPKKGSFNHIITQKQINAFTIILSFLKRGNIDFLQIMSYTIDEKTLYTLKEYLQQGKINKLQIIMTETASFRIPTIYKKLKDEFANESNCNLVFYWVHSKIHLILQSENKYVIDGSGNFSQNAQVEHYNVFALDELYDFHYNLSNDFFMGGVLRKNHEIFKNF